MRNILFVASEAVPFIKTGGLADVVGSLPRCFSREHFDVRVILPKYSCMQESFQEDLKYVMNFYMDLNWRRQYVGIFETEYEGIKFYFIDNEEYFKCDKPYEGMPDDLEKFAYFSKAALSMLPLIGFQPDIIHCHDWQTGLVPVYLKDSFQGDAFFWGIKSVMTIHNLKFQGIWNIDTVKDITGLSDYYFTTDKLVHNGDANYLKGGIVYADAVTTVSSTYSEEIKTAFYGEGLEGLMQARSNHLHGILNGIDYDEYNPQTDQKIVKQYTAESFRKDKVKNKTALQEELGLDVNPRTMMLGIVSRLTDQKGLDLIAAVMEEICQEDIQLVVLGTGDPLYENMFRHYAEEYPDRVSANIFYSEKLSHQIYASCDALLMPSLFEPCGLSQLMSLRYGTVPIVRKTGGLKDTVVPYSEMDGSGTGFCFSDYNAHEMFDTIRYAVQIYHKRKREWNKIVDRAMAADFSWNRSARQYEEVYRHLAGE